MEVTEMAQTKRRSKYYTEGRSGTVSDVVADAYDIIGDLADQMGEWRDNMEEKLSHTQKFEQVGECADVLNDNRDAPYFDEAVVGDIAVVYSETKKRKSRSGPSRQVQLDNAISRLNGAVDALESAIDEAEEKVDIGPMEELRDELQSTIDNLDGAVEFPGMYG